MGKLFTTAQRERGNLSFEQKDPQEMSTNILEKLQNNIEILYTFEIIVEFASPQIFKEIKCMIYFGIQNFRYPYAKYGTPLQRN